MFGDIFANEFSYSQLKNSLADQAMNRLNIIEGKVDALLSHLGVKYQLTSQIPRGGSKKPLDTSKPPQRIKDTRRGNSKRNTKRNSRRRRAR